MVCTKGFIHHPHTLHCIPSNKCPLIIIGRHSASVSGTMGKTLIANQMRRGMSLPAIRGNYFSLERVLLRPSNVFPILLQAAGIPVPDPLLQGSGYAWILDC
jgi:hypothetical protein